MKRFFALIASLTVLLATSCEDPNNEGIEPIIPTPDQVVDDPEGTISLKMRNANDGKTFLSDSGIYIDVADNFAGAQFASIGQVHGLGNVVTIPRSGWTDRVAVNPGEAYVAYSNGKFYRLYVENYILNASQEILGAEIKYQFPFGGGEPLEFSSTSVLNSTVVKVSGPNNTIADFSITCQSNLGTVKKVYDNTHSFLPIGFSFVPNEQDWHTPEGVSVDLIVESFSGKQTKITATVTGPDPYLYLENPECQVSARQGKIHIGELGVCCNFDYKELNVSSDAEWCKVVDSNTLNIADNYTNEPRTATITITCEEYPELPQTARIVQASADFYVDFDVTQIEVESKGNEDYYLYCDIYNPNGFDVSIRSNCDWIEILRIDDYYASYIAIGENTEGKTRNGKIIVSIGDSENTGVSYECEITQLPHTFQIEDSVNFDRLQSNSSVYLTTTASGFSAKSDKEWCTLSWNGNTMTIRVTANETNANRTATIEVKLNDGQTKQITVNQGHYTVGDLYEVGDVKGVVFETTGHNGKIISLDETQSQYSIESVLIGATNTEDGRINMDIVQKIPNWEELYPAFKWCADKGEGWYLPALDELVQMNNVHKLIHTTLETNGIVLDYKYYWSSTEHSNSHASIYAISYGYPSNDSKIITNNVRAVFAF